MTEMVSRISSTFLLLCVFFILLCTNINCKEYDFDSVDPNERGSQTFFKLEDIKVGNKIPIYFRVLSPSEKAMRFLPRKIADSFPFSSKYLPLLLKLFSFPENSTNAKKMEFTFLGCEREPYPMEIKFCATSREVMTEQLRNVFGSDAHIDVLATKLSPGHKTELQNYTVLGEAKKVDTHQQLGCHNMPYPYKVFFCHTQMRDHMTFKIPMVGDDGERIEAIGACHSDTSEFDPRHVVFKVLKTKPGSTVCHFIPADDYIFVRSPSVV